jgi:tetratricopeptide (TPR) repeat protein
MLIIDLETPGHINYHTPKPEDPDVAPVAEKTRETVDEDLDINLVAEMTLESNDDVDVDPLTQPVIRGHSSRPEEVDLLVTDQCPYYRLPPFTITKKHPSEVTSDTAAKAEAQAVEYDVIDDVTNAVPAYLDAIEQRAQVSGGDSASVCSLLSRLASIYNATGRLEESISTYRRAIAPYREGLLESVLRCVPDMCQLAEALISQGEYVEAEDIFRRAIQILAKEGDQIGTASYNLKLVELLQKQDRHEDAIGILHPLLNTQMQISGDDFASILCTLRHMKSSYEKLYSGGQCSGVITRMSSVVADLIGSNRLDSPRFFQGFLSIADSFSSKGEFGIATSMYKAAMSTASENPRPNCRYRKAQYLYYYAKHLCRIPDYATVLSHLQGSVAILVELGRREGKLAHRVRSFFNWILGDLERVEKNQDMLDNILKIQALLSGSRSTITSSNSQNVIRPADELESEGKSEMRTTTTSNKYGVTFSVSDITGISLSEFFVP